VSDVAEPEFFSPQWAAAVRDALTAGPSEQDQAGKLPMYWDSFEQVKAGYTASWALGCRDLPAALGASPAYLYVRWGGGTVTGCAVTGPEVQREATYVFGMDYADWRALHGGYDPQRTVMYRKILLEEGNVLEFFKSIYFFTECLGIIGTVPAGFPALAAR
jgi:hypothetical protein